MLDDSGSMRQQYTPDYVSSGTRWNDGLRDERMCYDSGDNDTNGAGLGDRLGKITGYNKICQVGDVPHMAPAFNSQYYNPAIRYRPGVTAAGVPMPSQDSATTSGWTSVRTDAFGTTNVRINGVGGTYDNLTQFPDRAWCDSPLGVPGTPSCRVNTTGYDYPNAIYAYGRSGPDNNSSIKYVTGQPYYWTIPNFEWCTDAGMTDCVVSANPATINGKSYMVPSTVRFCRYPDTDAYIEPMRLEQVLLNDCKARFDEDGKYIYPRFLGRIVPESSMTGATARLTFTDPTASQNIQSITIDGESIIGAATFSGFTSRNTIATAVANAINNAIAAPGRQEYRACTGTACAAEVGAAVGAHVVVIYAVTAPGGTTRMTGAATNNLGTPVVTGAASGPGAKSKTIISVQALVSAGTLRAGGLNQITVNGNLLLNSLLTFNTADVPASVATAIAAAINAGPSRTRVLATAVGATVELESRNAGTEMEGQAVTFDYANVPRRAAATFQINIDNMGVGAKTVTFAMGSDATCTQGPPVPLGTASSTARNSDPLADSLRAHLNGRAPGLIATGSSNVTTVQAPAEATYNGWYLCIASTAAHPTTTPTRFNTNGRSSMNGLITAPAFGGGAATGTMPVTVNGFAGGSDNVPVTVRQDQAQWTKVVIRSGQTYPKVASRSDCGGTTCTYEEEMTNFANWYAYYRTRNNMMKTAAGRSFSTLSDNFRVGFTTINDTDGSRFVKIRDFNAAQKTAWYTRFYAQAGTEATPLRAALSRAGRIFSGLNPLNNSANYEDPVQHSCQQNFVILTTDGYWNETAEGSIAREDGSRVNNADAAAGVAAPFFDGGPGSCPVGGTCLGATCHGASTDRNRFSSCNTLADVAYHFANTDLRRTDLNNCANQTNGGTANLCVNNVRETAKDTVRTQHMTTFTLGLGVDGTLGFQDDYETAGAGDYARIRAGTLKWPQVKNLHPTAVDDLWHAAVNGRGKYFSAKNPESLTAGLNGALAEVNAQGGAGAAAATSNLQPVSGDNFAYVGSYTTLKWTGNIEARQIDLLTAEVSVAAQWCAEDVIDPVTSNVSCSGTMKSLVSGNTDTRAIFTFDSTAPNKVKPFLFGSLTAAQKLMFAPTGLSQYAALDAAGQAAATGENLVAYLRGQTQHENRAANTAKVFRERERTLGDIVSAQPAYVKQSVFQYNDAGHSGYKGSTASRAGTVYVGANDGMLHAFDAVSGTERWAYVPSQMLPKMRQLADYSYPTNHRFFVDGTPVAADIKVGGVWKTILVGGFGAGGVGYYALDITDPASPKALWEFPGAGEADAGVSYSAPLIGKLADGTWAVIVSSGYNNSGTGYVYVLNANTGVQIRKVSVDSTIGTAASPSGLGRLTGVAPLMPYNNQIDQVYGGDLKGNIWRVNPSTGAVARIAQLRDGGGQPQPVTTKLEVAVVDGKTLLYFGTGKYLETGDLSSSQQQTVYGIRDTFDTDGTLNTRTVLNEITIVDSPLSGGGIDRTGTGASGSILTGRGWFANLPVSGERVNVDPQFVNGTVIFVSNVPSNTACTAGGSSFVTYFNFTNGSVIPGSTEITSAIIVGFVVVQTGSGFRPLFTKSNSATPVTGAPINTPNSDLAYRGKRVSWKELSAD